MTSIEILNLDSLLSCNESLLKFKNLHLFEEIKNNYILLLRKEENKKSNYINDEKFIVHQGRSPRIILNLHSGSQ